MRSILFFVVFIIMCHHLAHAELDPAFFQIGPNWIENQTQPKEDWQSSGGNTIEKGYPGEVIFDKYGKPVVFSGPEFDRKYAEDYVEKYNKSH